MISLQRILCPVDFSDHSRRALDNAVAIARWYSASVTVLHVFAPVPVAAFGRGPTMLPPMVLTAADRDALLAELRTFAEQESAPGVTITATLREGDAATEILAKASAMQADLVVVGTHGRSGFERFILGSVADKVLRKASCPVMTVPKRMADAVPTAPVLYNRILCPVDFSESSFHALKYALSIAQEADAQLTVLHAIEHTFDSTSDLVASAGHADVNIGAYLKKREEALQRRLRDETAGAADFCHIELLTTHGTPWRAVLSAAAERRCDLIVMGVHGRGGADLLFFGSTTEHVVRDAPCAVLTLRH